MNNYCTNCGERLDKKDLVCKNCNTPITKLPYNYQFIDNEKKEKRKKVFFVLGILLLCFITVYFVFFASRRIYYLFLQKKYVDTYLNEKYADQDYNVKFDYSGECIISGDCYFDPVMGCDGGACIQYKYYSGDCVAYYYKVEINDKKEYITVVNKENQMYVVEGKNMYGNDKKEEQNLNNNTYINDNKETKSSGTLTGLTSDSNEYTFSGEDIEEQKGAVNVITKGIVNGNNFSVTGELKPSEKVIDTMSIKIRFVDQNQNVYDTCYKSFNISSDSSYKFSCTKENLPSGVYYYKYSVSYIAYK